MNRYVAALLSCTVLASCGSDNGLPEPGSLDSDEQKFSYAIGFQVGSRVRQDSLPVDPGLVAIGVRDALSDASPRIPEDSMREAIVAYQQKRAQELGVLAEQNKTAGQEFRDKFADGSDVVKLESGVLYKVLKKGDGPSPRAVDTVVAHYRGALINGREFDSSYSRSEPETFAVADVIPGWRQVLPLMQVGAKWQVVIPPELGYGMEGAGDVIGPNETLVFDIELLDVKPAAE
jgi:FKBP-type peptidyl-prolyl cis-trans isomerase FklB